MFFDEVLQRVRSKDPTLIEVNLGCQNLNIENLRHLVEGLVTNPYVIQLNLAGNLLGDESIELILKCPFLRSLNLSGNLITRKYLFHFSTNETLLSLDLSYNNITDADIESLAENKALTELNLNGNKIFLADKLAANTRLIALSLMNNEIDSNGVQGFVHNTTLKRLFLDNNLLNDEGAIKLSKNADLEEVSLNYNEITDRGAIAFSKTLNAKLTNLSLAYNKIGDAGGMAFMNCTQLKKLNLAGNILNQDGISCLAQNTSIEWLDLGYNQVDDSSLFRFSKNRALTNLNLSYNRVTAKGVSFLVGMPQLSYLMLSHNQVGDEGAFLLAGTNLNYLDLSGNGIGFEGANALAKTTTIKTLILNSNHLGDPGAMLLANNKTIRFLALCYNNIGNPGAMVLTEDRVLDSLNLNYNKIDGKSRPTIGSSDGAAPLRFPFELAPSHIIVDRLGFIFNFIQNVFCVLGLEGKIHFCNPAFGRLLGYREDELLGSNLLNLLHPEDRIENHPLARLNQKFPVSNIDNRFLGKDGSYRVIRWNAQLNGNYIYSIGSDISVQQKLERCYVKIQEQREAEQLSRQEKAENSIRKQTEFIAHLSHEIRNPLGGAFSITEVMEEHLQSLKENLSKHRIEEASKDASFASEYLKDLKGSIKYAEEILNDNLDLARIAEKKLALQEKKFNLANTVEEAVKVLQAKAKQKKLSLIFCKIGVGDLWVTGDSPRVKQIVVNLVSNAIKFTEKGEVKVTLAFVKNDDGFSVFELSVADTGIGMSKEEAGSVFKRYSQLNTTLGSQPGTGLGLYISKKLGKLMGWDMDVLSEKGKGTTFVCRFSCKNLSHEARPIRVAESPPPLLFSREAQVKPKVLVVEDNEINRRVICEILKKQFICTAAENGQKAVEEFDKQPFDIILMDVLMPVMDGIEATRAIRAKEANRGSRVPIVALTANALESDKKAIIEAGMDVCLVKPVKRDEIVGTIYQLIKQPQLKEFREEADTEQSPPGHPGRIERFNKP